MRFPAKVLFKPHCQIQPALPDSSRSVECVLVVAGLCLRSLPIRQIENAASEIVQSENVRSENRQGDLERHETSQTQIVG
ncbi:hypothetical protein [Planctopirus hydrillae]|uniref:Uncharacterized protein n=1 Tax=Planctopirus hydrillae TaxID=1841610 RepID=A0A1C3E3N6_9PLAN|nr:hypothetical protein [Planctopirus hydrillae]ODA27861.1 hypothetical protein A6X21_14990 [Planctopirus hydrillae]